MFRWWFGAKLGKGFVWLPVVFRQAGHLQDVRVFDRALGDECMDDYLLQWPATRRMRVLAATSYLGILCLIPLIFDDDSKYVRFHARQGLVLWLWTLLAVFSMAFGGIGGFFLTFSMVIIVFLSLMGIVSVVFSQDWRLPVIAVLAEKL